MNRWTSSKKLFLIFLLVLQPSVFANDASEWLLTNINLIDIESGQISKGASIWIKNDKIMAINPSSTSKALKKVSGNNYWVIPGLSEMHAHIPNSPDYTDRILKLFIAHGITNVRGMLGQPFHLTLRQELNSGKKLGPYLVTSGPSINGNSVKSPQEGVDKVSAQVKAGYDFHKIHPGLSKTAYQAITKTASQLNSTWGGHISAEVGIVDTIKAGQSTIDHMDGFIEELAKRNGNDLSKQGFFGFSLASEVADDDIDKLIASLSDYNFAIVPTETLMVSFATPNASEHLLNNPAHKWMPQHIVNNWKNSRENFWSNDEVTASKAARFLEVRKQLLQAFKKHNVLILLGSDAPQVFNVPGDSTHKELAIMVDNGLTPLEALQSGTLNVEKFYQGKHPVGKIVPGMRADFVLLKKNPLENIENSRSIDSVVVAGKLLDRNALDKILDKLEQ